MEVSHNNGVNKVRLAEKEGEEGKRKRGWLAEREAVDDRFVGSEVG